MNLTLERITSLAVASLVAVATPAVAVADQGLCGVTQASALEAVASELEGRWVTEFKPGYAVAGPMVIPHPAAPAPETGHLETREGRLTIVPDNARGVDLALEWETGVDWSFDAQPALPAGSRADVPDLEIDDDDLAVLAGCAVNDLPRLVGTTSVTMEGVSMTLTARLMVISTDLIYGFQQVHGTARGQAVVERRPFVMSR